MEVQVVDALPRLLPDVGYHPVALQPLLPAQSCDDLEDVGHHGAVAAIHLRHGGDGALGITRKWVGA